MKKGVGTEGQTNGKASGRANGTPPNGHSKGTINGLTKGLVNRTTNANHTNGTNRTSTPYNTAPEPKNPTVLPIEALKQFHFTFLIRHPRHSIPSYFRCTIPPLDDVTGFYNFMPSEAGYDELRRVFDYLRAQKLVGPSVAGQHGVLAENEVSITVIDADDLLDDPESIVKTYCKEVGFEYTPDMLVWDTEEAHTRAKEAFEKWKGFHEDAIESTSLKPRTHAHVSLSCLTSILSTTLRR